MKGSSIDPYEALGNAVVLQAVKDYRRYYRRLLRHANDRSAEHEVKVLEKYFVGPYFNTFTSLDGEMLLKRLKEEMEEKV